MSMDSLIEAGEAGLLVPGPSDRGFRIGLYLEHLEEASFLYEQRLSLLDDPELTWFDLHDFEDRFEAHVDALVLGEELAVAVCVQQAKEGDFGELHTAVRVFCRRQRMDLLDAVVASLDQGDAERMKAVSDALSHEIPARWAPALERKLADDQPLYPPLIARALGYGRIGSAEALTAALGQANDSSTAAILWSLGRLRASDARSLLFKTYLQRGGAVERFEAAVALLRIGEPAALQYVSGAAGEHPWAALVVGLSGSRAHLPSLLEIAASKHVSGESLLALGLLGDIASVDSLLYHLGDEALAENAAAALYLITGAGLTEDVFLPDAVDEDDVFDDEPAATSDADPPESSGREEQRGTTITRVSQQPEDWQEWWRQNKSRFAGAGRYRLGELYSPAALLTMLRSQQTPRALRSLAIEEVAIRYGHDLRVETDAFVTRQMEALQAAEAWMEHEGRQFEPGKYYFAGRLQVR